MYLLSKLTIQSEITIKAKKKVFERNVSVIHGQFVQLSECNQTVNWQKKKKIVSNFRSQLR